MSQSRMATGSPKLRNALRSPGLERDMVFQVQIRDYLRVRHKISWSNSGKDYYYYTKGLQTTEDSDCFMEGFLFVKFPFK